MTRRLLALRLVYSTYLHAVLLKRRSIHHADGLLLRCILLPIFHCACRRFNEDQLSLGKGSVLAESGLAQYASDRNMIIYLF